MSKCFDILTSLRNTVSKADSKVLLQLLKILERLGQTFQLLKQSFTSHVLYQITTLKNAANLPENSNINFFLLVLGNFSEHFSLDDLQATASATKMTNVAMFQLQF